MNELIELLQFAPFQRALMAGVCMAVMCGGMGALLVARREAILGHSLSNIAFLGVVLGLLLGTTTSLGVALLLMVGVVLLSVFMQKRSTTSDSLLEYTAQMSMGLAMLGLQFFSGYQVDPMVYLFGDILAISPVDVWVSGGLVVLFVLVLWRWYGNLVQVAIDRDMAASRGLRLWVYDTLSLLLVAGIVFVGMKIVGVILLSAFLVIPANISKLWTKSFRSYMFWSSVIGALGVISGLLLSYYWDMPSGPMIVVLLGVILMVGMLLKKRS